MGLKIYLTFDELSKLWGIPDFEILECVKKGLTAYDRLGRRTISERHVEYKPEESIDEFRQRLYLRESKAEQLRIEKNNSSEYRYNAHLLSIELPSYEVYDENEVMKRVKKRVSQEYGKLELFPCVSSGHRLIPSESDDNETLELFSEIHSFLFCREDVNRFAADHGYPVINNETSLNNCEAIKKDEKAELKQKAKLLTIVQSDKWNAIDIAKEYIRHCKGVPSIKKAVSIVQDKFENNGWKVYQENTIRNWIAGEFKDERSHKKGRPKKKQ